MMVSRTFPESVPQVPQCFDLRAPRITDLSDRKYLSSKINTGEFSPPPTSSPSPLPDPNPNQPEPSRSV